MPRPWRKVLIAVVVLAAAGTYLGYAAESGWVYFLDVDRLLDQGPAQGRVRVHGVVARGAEIEAARLGASFELEGGKRRVLVAYRGPVPELFGEGRQVVVEGELDRGGIFRADVLLTKCASKYEAVGAHPGGGR